MFGLMTITVDIRPEVQAELAGRPQTTAAGSSLAARLLEDAVHFGAGTNRPAFDKERALGRGCAHHR